MADQPQKSSVVEMAKKQRHIYLYEKLSSKKPLSRSELKELSKYEEKESAPWLMDSQEQVSKAFGVSARTVANWIKDSMPVRSDGKYDTKDIQAWRFKRKSDRGGHTSNKARLDHWDAQYREFKARTQEILYRKNIGELVERNVIEEGLIAVSIAIKRALLSLPRSLAPVLTGLEPREIEKVLTDKIKETINLFAKDKIFSSGKKEKPNAKNRKTRHMDRKSKAGVGSAGRSVGFPVGGSSPHP